MIQVTYPPLATLRCPNCDGDRFIDDFHCDDRVCLCCGAIVERGIACHLDIDESRGVRAAGRGSGAYQRKYHLAERLKQMRGDGPATPDDIIELVHDAFRLEGGTSTRLDDMSARWIKSVCVTNGCKQYAERWIEIRSRVAGLFGVSADIPELTATEEQELARRFILASTAFDAIFYRPGRRATRRDHSIPASHHRLARHNMLNYNYVFHQLFMQLGVRRRIRAHFFFSLPTTARVLASLLARWTAICRHIGDWTPYPTDAVLDVSCASDPALMFTRKRTVYASRDEWEAAFRDIATKKR